MNKKKGHFHINSKNWSIVLWVVCLSALVIAGGLSARYITTSVRSKQMQSVNFHIGSDYLKPTTAGAAYNVSDWGAHGIDIQFYNYETENTAKISKTSIEYTITTSDPTNWKATVKDSSDHVLTPGTGDVYTLSGGSQTVHNIYLQYNGSGTPDEVTVMIKTVDPYIEILQADFTLIGKKLPDYTVKDNGTYCLVTIQTNDYEDALKVEWDPAKFSPDNTNPLMTAWTDAVPAGANWASGSFDTESYHTYELIFVKKTVDTFNKTGSGSTVPLHD